MKKLKQVLLVDDDLISRYHSEVLFSEMNAVEDLVVKENGQEALEYIQQCCLTEDSWVDSRCPQVILLDVNMPVMSGIEFLEALQSLHKRALIQTKVVLLTNSNHARDLDVAERFGVKGYINKPLTQEKIHHLVSSFDVHPD